MVGNSSEGIADILPVLRSNLNATELTLAKFISTLRRQLVIGATKSVNANPESVAFVIASANKLQTDFTEVKSRIDLMLALTEHLL